MSDTQHKDPSTIRELVAFRLGDQEYCVDIMAVREIRGWSVATPVPHSAAYVRGVINLRGAVLPIVDLALRLGYKAPKITDRHVIIVIQHEDKIVGMLVDAVSDILTVMSDKIQPTPDVASELAKEFVHGVIALDNRMIRLIGIDRILPMQEKEAA